MPRSRIFRDNREVTSSGRRVRVVDPYSAVIEEMSVGETAGRRSSNAFSGIPSFLCLMKLTAVLQPEGDRSARFPTSAAARQRRGNP